MDKIENYQTIGTLITLALIGGAVYWVWGFGNAISQWLSELQTKREQRIAHERAVEQEKLAIEKLKLEQAARERPVPDPSNN